MLLLLQCVLRCCCCSVCYADFCNGFAESLMSDKSSESTWGEADAQDSRTVCGSLCLMKPLSSLFPEFLLMGWLLLFSLHLLLAYNDTLVVLDLLHVYYVTCSWQDEKRQKGWFQGPDWIGWCCLLLPIKGQCMNDWMTKWLTDFLFLVATTCCATDELSVSDPVLECCVWHSCWRSCRIRDQCWQGAACNLYILLCHPIWM